MGGLEWGWGFKGVIKVRAFREVYHLRFLGDRCDLQFGHRDRHSDVDQRGPRGGHSDLRPGQLAPQHTKRRGLRR